MAGGENPREMIIIIRFVITKIALNIHIGEVTDKVTRALMRDITNKDMAATTMITMDPTLPMSQLLLLEMSIEHAEGEVLVMNISHTLLLEMNIKNAAKARLGMTPTLLKMSINLAVQQSIPPQPLRLRLLKMKFRKMKN
mmetsp:Transcript_22775/g.47522  ORF Transcript_22775/g.47522 Transcript_22775/m.47522 type:complete len:140 (+) Transcript_22775:602-1021(+)